MEDTFLKDIDLSTAEIKPSENLPRLLSANPAPQTFPELPQQTLRKLSPTPRVLERKIPGLQLEDEDEDKKPKRRIKPVRLLMPADLQVVLYREPPNSPKIIDLRYVNLDKLNISITKEFRIPLDNIPYSNRQKSIKPHPRIEELNENSNDDQIQNQQLVTYRSPQRAQTNTSQTQLPAQLRELQSLSYNHQKSNDSAFSHMEGYTLKLNMSLLRQALQKQTYTSQTQTNKQQLVTYSPQTLENNTSQSQLPAQDTEFVPLSRTSLIDPTFTLRWNGYEVKLNSEQSKDLLEQQRIRNETNKSQAKNNRATQTDPTEQETSVATQTDSDLQPAVTGQTARTEQPAHPNGQNAGSLSASLGFEGESNSGKESVIPRTTFIPIESIQPASEQDKGCFKYCAIS